MEEINVFSIDQHINFDLIEQNSDKLLNDYIYVKNDYPIYKYSKELWFENPLFDEDYTFYMQSLFHIGHLLDYYKIKEDDRYLDHAVLLFYNWYEENFKTNYYKKNTGLTIALRLLVVCNLFTTVKKIDLSVLDDTFENVILSHCALLESDKFYKKQSTVGLEQDIALFVSAIVLYYHYGNPNFLNLKLLVKERLMNQLDYLILEDGSFIEHSIERAYHICVRLIEFYPFLLEYGEADELSEYIKSKIDNLLIFVYALIEPGGIIPNIGLGNGTHVDLDMLKKYNHSLLDHIKYIVSNGKEGKKILYHNVYFPNSNYVISVNKNEIDYQFMRLFIYGQFNPTIEKHYDHIGFTFYYKGLPLLIDSGYFENKDSMYYQSISSVYGHNTVCVDKHDYLIDKSFINKCGITNISINKQLTLISTVNGLYEGVMLRRNFLFIKDHYLIIIDEFESVENHQYEILYNVNPLLTIKNHELEYIGELNDEQYLSIKNLYCTENCSTSYYYGNKKEYRGFYTQDGKEVKPCHQIGYKMKGSNVLTISLMTFNPQLHVSYQIVNQQINFKIGEDVYSIISNKYYRYLEKNGTLIHDEKTNNKSLINTINDFYRRNK